MDTPYKKRSQRDYTLGFKLSVVEQVEKGLFTYKQAQKHYGIQGRSTVLTWLRKHGNLDWTKLHKEAIVSNPKAKPEPETPIQAIKRLERQLSDEQLKNSILNDMVDLLDQQYGTQLRKKHLAKQLKQDGVKKKSP
jgi:transposase